MPDISSTRPAAGAPVDTPWGQQVHDMLEGIQAGSVSVNFSNSNLSNSAAVVFPRPYTVAPIIVAVCANANYSPGVGATATQANLQAKRTDSAAVTAAMTILWIAIGTPA